jgi:hypothetical protein
VRRALLNTSAAVSFVILLATPLMWARSQSFRDTWAHWEPGTGTHRYISSARGDLLIFSGQFPKDASMLDGFWSDRFDWNWRLAPGVITFLGFEFSHGTPPRRSYWMIGVPYWSVMVVLLIAPTAWLRRQLRLRRARLKPWICTGCGYDLRATPARCPECGFVPAPSSPDPPTEELMNPLARCIVLVAIAIMALLSFGAEAAMPTVNDLPEQHDMPDPLVMANGQRVTSAAQWPARREEMKRIVEYYLTGTMPPPPGNVRGEELEERDIDGGKVHFKRVKITFGPETKPLGFEVGVFVPTDTSGPVPTFVHVSFFPTPGAAALDMPPLPTTRPAPATTRASTRPLFPRTMTPERALETYSDALARGYAVVTFNYQECGWDRREGRNSSGFFPAYPQNDWGDLAAWAWSMSRVVDYLQTQDFADKTKLIAIGHSRLGKTTLIAGAFDERFALVAPCGSGCAGTGAFRFNGPGRGGKQGIEDFATRFDYQLGPRMPQFIDHVYRLPFDQHWLIAMVAPRPFISAEGLDDGACNGKATKASILAARPVFDLLGVSDKLAVNFRPGRHMLAPEDWTAVLDFADQQLRGKKIDRRFDTFPPDDELH